MSIQVRTASDSDSGQLLKWVRAFHLHHAIAEPAGGLRNAVMELVGDPGLGCIWIIEAGTTQQPIGYVAICYGYSIEFGGRDAFIDEMFLEPPFRGLGHGKTALQQVVAATRRAGIRALHLEVAHDNTSADRLYSQLGFEKREHYRLMTLVFE